MARLDEHARLGADLETAYRSICAPDFDVTVEILGTTLRRRMRD